MNLLSRRGHGASMPQRVDVNPGHRLPHAHRIVRDRDILARVRKEARCAPCLARPRSRARRLPRARGRTRIGGVWVIARAERCLGCGHEFNACGCGERVPAPWADTYVMDREAA